MKKRASCLLVIMAAMTFAMTPRGAGSDYLFNSEEYPSYAVLLYALPSNAGYKWSKDFSGRPGAANDWLVNNIAAGAAGHYGGFAAILGGFSVLRGTSRLYTITGVGFTNAVDSAFATQILRERLADARTVRSGDECCFTAGRFRAFPLVTVHEENGKGGYATFRYKAIGLALGHNRGFGPFTLGGADYRYGDSGSHGCAGFLTIKF